MQNREKVAVNRERLAARFRRPASPTQDGFTPARPVVSAGFLMGLNKERLHERGG
jgi:hypothetical protein